jgi:hypothetical protein
VREEDEPGYVEENRGEEKESVGTAKALTAALNGDEGEQRDGQIKEQDSVVQSSKGSDQRATNLHAHIQLK